MKTDKTDMKFKIIYRSLWIWFLSPCFWTKWIDVTTFTYSYSGYLLQGRRNKLSNAKQFRITILKQSFKMAEAPMVHLDTLKQLGL